MPPDPDRLRATVERLERIERPPASAGERAAAAWIRARFAGLGLQARIEAERAVGSFPLPLGVLSALGAAAGLVPGRRALAWRSLAAAAAAGAIADDVSGGRRWFRRALPQRVAHNVVAELGDPAAPWTIVFAAHHDAARGGLVFHPGPTRRVADTFPRWYERQETSPPLMRLVLAGPLLAATGAALGRPAVRRAGGAMALLTGLAMADIAMRPVVPGANDNLAAVAVLLELARLLHAAPPPGTRVVFLSTGSEESLLEGMRGFLDRHAAALDPARTRFVVLECIAGPEAILLEGEGMLRVRDYPAWMREWLAAAAERAGQPLRRGLRTGLATDALVALRRGYPAAVLASIDRYKMAANYHSPQDVAANADFATAAAVCAVCLEAARSLSSPAPAPAPA
jgi:Peptidase family M28